MDKKLILIIVLTVILLSLGAFLVIKKGDFLPVSTSSKASPTPLSTIIFDSQSAMLTGQITKVEGQQLTVQKAGQEAQFPIASNAKIYTYYTNSPQPLISSDLKDIKLGQTAQLNLVFRNGRFEVNAINYNSAATKPRTATSSANINK